MKFFLVSFSFFILAVHPAFSQQSGYKPIYDNLVPVSPAAFQFLKYTEMPVSEYTGIPGISVPIYTISEDGVEIPIVLSYHAGGIRVNQDASWVGLGWDMTFGSVIQIVNDRDDIDQLSESAAVTSSYPKLLPDYYSTSVPDPFPTRYDYSYGCSSGGMPPGYNWSATTPIYQPGASFGYKIVTDAYFPYNGDFNQRRELFFTDYRYDSEPDIFKANFFGHSISFIRTFSNFNYQYKILNKGLNQGGYKLSRQGGFNNDLWVITTPAGDNYYFEERVVANSFSSSSDYMGGGVSPSTDPPSTKTWMLTKIITRNKSTIQFTYSRNGTTSQFPSFSQKFNKMNGYNVQTNVTPSVIGVAQIGTGNCIDCYGSSTVTTTEDNVVLSSITFTNGRVDFFTSSRTDVSGGVKLDRVEVKTTQLIKSAVFNYSYFDASSVGGTGFSVANNNFNILRLKLNSLDFNDGTKYTFGYNTTPLPKKNSWAVDYWGYYNGLLTNTSMVPNPVQFSRPDIGSINNDNHGARIEFAKACVLEKITYPTGGFTTFDYGLHEFDNYWVPDFSTNSNTISKGHGLRVQAISFYTDNNTIAKKTTYEYQGGKAIQPRQIIRNFRYRNVQGYGTCDPVNGYIPGMQFNNYDQTYEISSNGFFSANPLGSINGVGYSKVIRREVDINNQATGRIENTYTNNPDQTASSAVTNIQLSTMLPMIKKLNEHENGSLIESSIYDASNNLLKKSVNSYYTTCSDIYYGVRVYFYGSLLVPTSYSQCGNYQGLICGWGNLPMYLFGFYPIYDSRTLLSQTETFEYSNGLTKSYKQFYGYDSYDLLSSISMYDNIDYTQEITNYDRTYHATGTVRDYMMGANRLSDIWKVKKYIYPNGSYPPLLKNEVTVSYKMLGSDKFVEDQVNIIERNQAINNSPKTTTYDIYDPATANLLQYTANGTSNSLIWGYSNQYVIANISNATQDKIAYTSFEGEGTGNWSFNTGTTSNDNLAPVGEKVYGLWGGNITKSNLPQGKYIVSYWSNSGQKTVSGTVSVVQGRSVQGWTLYEHKINNTVTGTLSVSGSGSIDDLKLFPELAIMTSYTHRPLTGVLTTCDAANRITYYEYDLAGRLVVVKDQDKNVIKKYCYNYAGQQNDCDSSAVVTVPVINSVTQISSLTLSVSYTPTSNCTGATITYLDLTTNQSGSNTQGCNSPRTISVAASGRTYRITVTCYPGSVTSAPVDIFIPY